MTSAHPVRHWPRLPQVLADVFAIRPDRSHLPRPQRHRIRSVRLHRQDLHAQHRRKRQKRATPRHSIQHPSQKCSHGEPDPVPVHIRGKRRKMGHLPIILVGGPCLVRRGRNCKHFHRDSPVTPGLLQNIDGMHHNLVTYLRNSVDVGRYRAQNSRPSEVCNVWDHKYGT